MGGNANQDHENIMRTVELIAKAAPSARQCAEALRKVARAGVSVSEAARKLRWPGQDEGGDHG